MVELDTVLKRVAFIVDNIPGTESNDKLLLLAYWQLFDNIEIPSSIITEILQQATPPETVSRRRREVIQSKRILREVTEYGQRNNQD